MEGDNIVENGQENQQGQEGQNNVEITDTSSEEFFFGGKEKQGSDFIETEVEGQEGSEGNNPQNNAQGGQEDSGYKGENEHKALVYEFATQNGIPLEDFFFDKLDEKEFSKEDAQYLIGRHQAMKHLETTDPVLHTLVSKNIPVDNYINERMQYENLLKQDDKTIFKGRLYDYLYKTHSNAGLLEVDEKGQLSQKSYDKIIAEINSHMEGMTDVDLKKKADAIRNSLQQEITKIPEYLQKRNEEFTKKQEAEYQNSYNKYILTLKDSINKTSKLVTDFSDQSEKDKFMAFVEKQTQITEVEHNGQKIKVNPLFHKLQNDPDFLLKTIRFHQLLEAGFFTDVSNKAKEDAFKALGLKPKGGSSGNKGGQKLMNGVPVIDTSTPESFNK